MMKRNTIIAVMISFCFTASLFMIIPIRSAVRPYNPWLDYDENGALGLTDLVNLANSYGTTGDPTKNVNVSNFPSCQPIQAHVYTETSINETIRPNKLVMVFVNTSGYSRMFVSLEITSAGYEGIPVITIVRLANISWNGGIGAWEDAPTLECHYKGDPTQLYYMYSQQTPAEFKIKNSECYLNILIESGSSQWWICFNVNVYLRNE